MEALALSHSFVAYESPESELQVKSLDQLGLKIPNSAWIGVASMAIALSVLSVPGEAQASCHRRHCGGHGSHHSNYAQVATNGGRLNIRHSASRCSRIRGKLYNGDSVALSGRYKRGWAELADGGWVSKKWIY